MKTHTPTKKTSLIKSSLAVFVFVIISLFLFAILIFSGPTPMKIYTNYLKKHTSANTNIETYNKDEFSQIYFHQDFQVKGFYKNFEKQFGAQGKKKNLLMVFYDIKDKSDSCIHYLYGISRYTDLVFVSKRRVCVSDTSGHYNQIQKDN